MQLSVRMSHRSCCGRAARGKSTIRLHRKASISRDSSECKGGAQEKLLLDAKRIFKSRSSERLCGKCSRQPPLTSSISTLRKLDTARGGSCDMTPLIRTLWQESATWPPSTCSNVNSSAMLDGRTRIRRVCFSFFVRTQRAAAHATKAARGTES